MPHAASTRVPRSPDEQGTVILAPARPGSAPATVCASGAKTTSRSTSAPDRSAGSPRASRTPRGTRGTSRATSSFPATSTSTSSWTSSSGKRACVGSIGRAGSSSRTATSGTRSRTTSLRFPKRRCWSASWGWWSRRRSIADRAYRNFEEWVYARFGAGVAKHFMVPYNLKVWSTPLDRMGFYWIAERVARRGLEKGPRDDAGLEEHGLGPQRDLRLPGDSRHRRPLARLPASSRRPRPAAKADDVRGRAQAGDSVLRRHRARLRPAPDGPAARGVRRPAGARPGSGSGRFAQAPLQPALLRRHRPEAALAVHEELDLLPQPEDAVLSDDVPLQLFARHRPRRGHVPLLRAPDGDDLFPVPARCRKGTSCAPCWTGSSRRTS